MKSHKLLPKSALAVVASIVGVLAIAFAFSTALAQSSALELGVTSTPVLTPVPPEFLSPQEMSQESPGHSCVGDRCEFRVESSTDDAGLVAPFPPVGSCSYSTSSNEIWLGECPDGEAIISGFRFPSVTIPKDALIVEAYLEFTVDGPYDNNILSEIYGELSPNPQPFGPPPSRPADRSSTFNFVTWSVPSTDPWQLSQTRRTPDLTTVLQEIVDQGNWQPGNAVAFIVEGVPLGAQSDPDAGQRHRRVIGIERPPTTYSGNVARLIVRLAAPQLDSVEFTQATQELQSMDELKADLAADGEPPVPIVALKPAVLRVYMQEVAAVTQVRIRVRIPGVLLRERTITLQPGCTPEESRKQESNCLSADFYFGPPEGNWTATVTTFDEQDNEIESHDLTLTSRTVKPLLQVPVSVCRLLLFPARTECEDGRKLSKFLPLLRAGAPTHRVQLVGDTRTVTIPGGLIGNVWWAKVLVVINSIWAADGRPDRYYHGMVHKDAPGNAGGIGLFNAAASRVRSLTGRGFERTEGTVAHETGHMLGRNHTGKADPDPPCKSSSLFPLLPEDWPHTDNRIQEVGFNVAKGEALDPQTVFDWMGYCPPPIWVSPHTYTKVMDTLRNHGSHQAQSLVQGSFWQLTGIFEDSDLVLDPLFAIEASGSVDSGTGSHRIDVLDANGNVLFTRFFDPAVIHTDPIVTTNGTVGEEFAARFFSELVPVQATAVSIVIADPDGIELAGLALEGVLPTVTITFPAGGEKLEGEQELAWEVADPDSATHTYRVEYSPDDGVSRHVLSTDISETRLLVNFDDLPGCSGGCLIRVLASDGVNTGVGSTVPFTVPSKPPLAEILFPGDGSVLQLADLAWLQGLGWDPDDGYLEGIAMQWISSLDGPLGNGDELPTTALSEGTHVVTFTATDSDGNSASDSITVQVDGTDPALELSILSDGIPVNCVEATIDATDEAGGSALAAVEFSLDGGETFESVPLDDLPFSTFVPGRGFFHVIARAIDKAGNLAALDQRFFIDAGCAELAITKADNPDPITLGQNLTYTVTVSNNGPSDASGVTVTDFLPAEVAFVSAAPSQGTCTHAIGTVTCDLGDVANGAGAEMIIVVSLSASGTISNMVSVAGIEADPDESNNSASTLTMVFVPIDIRPDRFPNTIELEEILEEAEDAKEEICEIEIDEDEDEVDLDIGDGVLPVAILTTPVFDAQTVDGTEVELGDPALGGTVMPIGSHVMDVDDDGADDLLLFFCIPEMAADGALESNTTELVLIGETFDSTLVTGTDSVLIVLDDDDEVDDDDDDEAEEEDEDNDVDDD